MFLALRINGNEGYGPSQVTSVTLGDLVDSLTEAADEFGRDAKVVVLQTNQHRGARYGSLSCEVTLEEDES